MTDFTDDEAMAAEYVLGTLDGIERDSAVIRLSREPEFERMVFAWEARFAPLALAAPELTPPAELFASLMSRLPGDEALPFANDNILLVRRQLRVWRGVAAIASAVAAMLALWIVGREAMPAAVSAQTYVAVLQQGANTPSFVVSVDFATRRMAVMPLATTAPNGKSYELWMIGGEHATPQSMGIIDTHGTMRPHLPDVDTGVLSHATYAVTIEPQGGSPTGQPTSAPVFAGKLIATSL